MLDSARRPWNDRPTVLLLVFILLAALGIGSLTGGTLGGFDRVRIHWWALAILALAAQLLPVGGRTVALTLLSLSYVGLVVFAIRNLRAPGFPLILIGLALNWLVIGLNGGMPVTAHALVASGQADTMQDLQDGAGSKHHLADGDTLQFLGDVIPLGGPVGQVISVGDVAVYVGIGWFVVAAMRRGRPDGSDVPDGLSAEDDA
jgi:hypothetical protein